MAATSKNKPATLKQQTDVLTRTLSDGGIQVKPKAPGADPQSREANVTPTNDQGTGCRGSQGVHSKAGAGIPCCTLGGQPPYGGLSHFGVIEGGLA